MIIKHKDRQDKKENRIKRKLKRQRKSRMRKQQRRGEAKGGAENSNYKKGFLLMTSNYFVPLFKYFFKYIFLLKSDIKDKTEDHHLSLLVSCKQMTTYPRNVLFSK